MAEELRAASLFQRVSPSVLTVSEKRNNPSAAPDGPTGTGFVWDGSHVVTNFHVVRELKDPHVTFLRKGEGGASDEHVTVGAVLRQSCAFLFWLLSNIYGTSKPIFI
eukprot:symbB.v1.2.001099.t1/scaffold59.1/size365495/3